MVALTKRDDDWAGDAVGHNHSEDTHHPGISCPKLELIGLVLPRHNHRIFKKILNLKILISLTVNS